MFDHILGGLYGQALGDAWAMPAMLHPDDTWDLYGGWITEFKPAPEAHDFHRGLPAARITDDTEQAVALAESIIEEGKVTVQGAARAIVRWYDRVGGDTCPYVGPSTRRAVKAIKAGADLNTSGRYGDTNGSAMRVSPVGLIHAGQVEAAVADAALSCVPTHNTDVAISGAAAVAGAIAAAMQPGIKLEDIVQAGVWAAELGRHYGYRWIGASVPKRIALAYEIATQRKPERERILELYDRVGTGLPLTESVPAAFGVLVMAEGHPKQTAIYAAALSGDADTIGAMACAIAGAWKGASAFDRDVIAALKAANPEIDFDALARGLLAVALKNHPLV
ncbi:MAG TPA: ADP-ribosylglycohydrolase family protein [Levilinea sp.]|nr:ADP-ribosylglycohydrolase family protein [Levilinea sp.]